MDRIFILRFNNYYNRQIKKFDTLDEYLPYLLYQDDGKPGEWIVNFRPLDNVSTSQKILWEGDSPDYFLVVDAATNKIKSRWFVLDCVRVRGGEYSLSLHRDVLADFYNETMNADTFIEKAILSNDNPLIVNNENISVNQIKKSEVLLKDKTKRSWLVAYIDRKGDESLSGTVAPPGVSDLTSASKTEWSNNNGVITPIITNGRNFKANFGFRKIGPLTPEEVLNINLSQSIPEGTVSSSYSTTKLETGYVAAVAVVNNGYNDFVNKVGNTFVSVMGEIPESLDLEISPAARYNELLNLDGKTIKFDDDENIYKITVSIANQTKSLRTDSNNYKSLPIYQLMNSEWTDILKIGKNSDGSWSMTKPDWLYISMECSEISLRLTSMGSAGSLSYTIPAAREHLSDAPYDMICAPYETTSMISGSDVFTSDQLSVSTVFTELVKQYSGENAVLYDLQRLPYCPISQIELNSNGQLDFSNWSDETKAFYITKDNVKVGVIFSCTVSNFSGSITLENPIEIVNPKMQSITERYRIVSPNYNGIFEIDPVMNGGLLSVNYFCTYKPFNPFIQVSPDFEYLYGGDFRDSRGMICGGDFSMPIMSDAWETYERQNKNFQDIFSRGIENLKITNEVQREQQIWSSALGVISGAGAGAYSGAAISGNLLGAGIGAGVGAIASIVGGVRDYQLGETLRNEAVDYRKTIHDLQLGNIKALPQSLSKTSAFVLTNKIWPFLEYYTCTDEEKESVAYSIAYEGMTVGRIDKLINYIDNRWIFNFINENGETITIEDKGFIQGKIVRMPQINEDYHISNEISNEISKGVYVR